MTSSWRRVCVDVSTGWTSPAAPRPVDAPALYDVPDIGRWLAAVDAAGAGDEGRRGLHDRTLTQLVRGEPVQVIEEAKGWVRVVAPWQPTPLDRRGYPVWVPDSHLTLGAEEADSAPEEVTGPVAQVRADRRDIAQCARRHLGLRYLWGGTTPYGLDCSGLVHVGYREAGVVVPRDADAQRAAAQPIPLGEERPGDLYFFARADGHVVHVGFVTGRGVMLHASGTEQRVVETLLDADRSATLCGAGRLAT